MPITQESDGMSEPEARQHDACAAPFPGGIYEGRQSSLTVIGGTRASGFHLNVRAVATVVRE